MKVFTACWVACGALAVSCGGAPHERARAGGAAPRRVVTYRPLEYGAAAKLPNQAVILGTDATNGSTILALPTAPASATLDAMFVATGSSATSGGTASVELGIAPNPAHAVQVSATAEHADGAGPSWRAGAWEAAFVAATALDKDVTDVTFSASSTGPVDGVSTSGLLAGGFLALLTGAAIDPKATLTGTIDPDGTIGPVAGVPELMLAAIARGKRELGYPAGMRMATSEATGQMVDVVELARAHGAEAVEIADVRDAYELLTHASLPGAVPVAAAEMALDARTRGALDEKYEARLAQLAPRLAALGPLVSADGSGVVGLLRDNAQRSADQAARLHQQGDAGAAYARILEAWTFARGASGAAETLAKIRAGDLDGALVALGEARKVGEATAAALQKIGALRPTTLGGHMQMLAGFSSVLSSWVLIYLVDAADAQAKALIGDLAGKSPDERSAAMARIANAVATTWVYFGGVATKAAMATDLLEFERDDNAAYTCSVPNVLRLAASYRSASTAGLAYVDQLLLEPFAKRANLPLAQAREQLAVNEPLYLTALSPLDGSDGLSKELMHAWGERSLPWALFSLAGAQLAYANVSDLIARYGSLGAHVDEHSQIASLDREPALAKLLETSERAARASARAAQVATGAIPVQAKLAYEMATVERTGDLSDRLDALSEYWSACALSQTAVVLARH